jgi:hypothetical protein
MYQTGPSDPIYNYLKNVIGGKVTKKRYLDFNWPDGVAEGADDEDLIPVDVLPFLDD